LPLSTGLKLYTMYIVANSITSASEDKGKRVIADRLTQVEEVPEEVVNKYLFLSSVGGK
jgi:uncharacterized protein (DUF2336 family)